MKNVSIIIMINSEKYNLEFELMPGKGKRTQNSGLKKAINTKKYRKKNKIKHAHVNNSS